MKKDNTSQTITLVEQKVTKKAKNTLYLVLKKKGFAQEIIDSIDQEIEKRLIEYLKTISPKLNQMDFDNPEKALECLLLNQMIKILDDMLKERMLKLNEEDKKIIFGILENKDENNQNPEEQK